MSFTFYAPHEIESRSFEIITEMMAEKKLNSTLDEATGHIVKRCIHTSADFDYAESLYFGKNAVHTIGEAFRHGCNLVTDTQMAKAGINKRACEKNGIQLHCFISDEDVAEEAKQKNETRASIAVSKAATLGDHTVFVIGNAPTALIKLHDLIVHHDFSPIAIIAVPVGFVNVVESKELIMSTTIPCIVARGNKGGSNIAAAICNAILYGAS